MDQTVLDGEGAAATLCDKETVRGTRNHLNSSQSRPLGSSYCVQNTGRKNEDRESTGSAFKEFGH